MQTPNELSDVCLRAWQKKLESLVATAHRHRGRNTLSCVHTSSMLANINRELVKRANITSLWRGYVERW